MVAAISGVLTVQVGWLGLRVGCQPALSLHSSNEPGELSHWLCHDDSIINIISFIIIIIIIIIMATPIDVVVFKCCKIRPTGYR